MNKKRTSILLVEDDPNLSMVLQDFLEMLSYDITACKDGSEGLSEFKKGRFDLCILDVMLPKKDGFALAEDIRKEDKAVPIIFLTAKSLKEDRIKGFRVGCDDYITKPFSTEELSLRIKAILKRSQNMAELLPRSETKSYEIGDYHFDVDNMILMNGTNERVLTRKETALLKLLCEHKNTLITREFALRTIWGDDDYFIGRSMDVFITKLRKYLHDDSRIAITNVHGTGFKLEVEGEV